MHAGGPSLRTQSKNQLAISIPSTPILSQDLRQQSHRGLGVDVDGKVEAGSAGGAWNEAKEAAAASDALSWSALSQPRQGDGFCHWLFFLCVICLKIVEKIKIKSNQIKT